MVVRGGYGQQPPSGKGRLISRPTMTRKAVVADEDRLDRWRRERESERPPKLATEDLYQSALAMNNRTPRAVPA